MRPVRRADSGRSSAWALVLTLLLTATAALAGCSGRDDTAPAPRIAEGLSEELAGVVQAVLPSVVEISQPGSVGSGVVFDRSGHIVTNAHVVGTGKAFEVRFANSSAVRTATLVYSWPLEDIAVIKVQDTGGLVPAQFGAARDLQVGDIVMAMGSPLGLESSVTQGVVSALGRTVSEPPEPQIGLPGTVLRQTIQTSAPINPGNSGGALVSLDRKVVGIFPVSAAAAAVSGEHNQRPRSGRVRLVVASLLFAWSWRFATSCAGTRPAPRPPASAARLACGRRESRAVAGWRAPAASRRCRRSGRGSRRSRRAAQRPPACSPRPPTWTGRPGCPCAGTGNGGAPPPAGRRVLLVLRAGVI